MIYTKVIERARSRKRQIQQVVKRLSNCSSREVDAIFHEAHEAAFTEVDCLKCANCCKTTGPLFTSKDVERISRHLKISSQEFIRQYLNIDEDNDYVLQSTPCKFLDESNYCSIYSVRPRACAEYPHTNRSGMKGIMELTYKNAMICPAVAKMFEEIEGKIHSG